MWLSLPNHQRLFPYYYEIWGKLSFASSCWQLLKAWKSCHYENLDDINFRAPFDIIKACKKKKNNSNEIFVFVCEGGPQTSQNYTCNVQTTIIVRFSFYFRHFSVSFIVFKIPQKSQQLNPPIFFLRRKGKHYLRYNRILKVQCLITRNVSRASSQFFRTIQP